MNEKIMQELINLYNAIELLWDHGYIGSEEYNRMQQGLLRNTIGKMAIIINKKGGDSDEQMDRELQNEK